MKNLLYIFLLCAFISCKEESKSFVNPDDVGKKVFSVLKGLNYMSLEDFKKSYVTYEEINELANDSDAPIGGYNRGNLKSITQKTFDEIMSKDYNEIKSEALRFGIQWDKISFIAFKHRIQDDIDNKNGKVLIGETYFKNYNGETYFILSASLFDGNGYRLVKIQKILPKSKSQYTDIP